MDMKIGPAGWRDAATGDETKGKMHVFFRRDTVKNNFKSARDGAPRFDSVVHIVKLPLDPYLRIDRKMRESDKEEYPVEWARFENGQAQAPTGMPIDAWWELSDTQKAEFMALNILTVEQFANAPDSLGNKIMGFAGLREKARLITSPKAELDKRMHEQDSEIAALKAQLSELTAKRGPGRPPKVDNSEENHA